MGWTAVIGWVMEIPDEWETGIGEKYSLRNVSSVQSGIISVSVLFDDFLRFGLIRNENYSLPVIKQNRVFIFS